MLRSHTQPVIGPAASLLARATSQRMPPRQRMATPERTTSTCPNENAPLFSFTSASDSDRSSTPAVIAPMPEPKPEPKPEA